MGRIYSHNGTLSGVAKTVIEVLQKAIGFDFEIVQPPENVIGIYNEADGKWTGVLGMLQRGVSGAGSQSKK